MKPLVRLSLLAIILCYTNIVSAQVMPNIPNAGAAGSTSDHVSPLDAPPHKGVIKEAGKYYIEVVVNWMLSNNNAVIYLIKSNGTPVPNSQIECTAQIEKTATDPINVPVKKWGENAHSTHLDASESYQLRVTFHKKKKKYSAIFQTDGKH